MTPSHALPAYHEASQRLTALVADPAATDTERAEAAVAVEKAARALATAFYVAAANARGAEHANDYSYQLAP